MAVQTKGKVYVDFLLSHKKFVILNDIESLSKFICIRAFVYKILLGAYKHLKVNNMLNIEYMKIKIDLTQNTSLYSFY